MNTVVVLFVKILRFAQAFLRQLAFLLLFLGAFNLSCIAKVPKEPLSPAKTAWKYQNRTLDNPFLKMYVENVQGQEALSPFPKAWDLERLTLAALYYHPDLDVARAQWQIAETGIKKASARPNPLLQAQPRFSTNPGNNISPWYIQAFSGFVIETAGKRNHRIQQAAHLSEVSHLNLSQVAWQVRSRLRNHLVTTIAAQRREDTLAHQRASLEDALNGFRQLLVYGEGSRLDVAQYQVTLTQLAVQLNDAHRAFQEGQALTAQALGIPGEALTDVTFDTQWFYHPPKESLSRLVLRQDALWERGDILALLEEYQAADEALRLAVSQRYPDIRIGPGYLWNQGQNFWALPLDVFFSSHFSSKGAIEEALAKRNEVAARFLALQAQIIGEVDRGVVAYQEALENLKAANTLVMRQQARKTMIQGQLEAGEVDRMTLRLAEVELGTAEIAQVDTLEKLHQALGILEDAIQRPLTGKRPLLEKLEGNPRTEMIERRND